MVFKIVLFIIFESQPTIKVSTEFEFASLYDCRSATVTKEFKESVINLGRAYKASYVTINCQRAFTSKKETEA